MNLILMALGLLDNILSVYRKNSPESKVIFYLETAVASLLSAHSQAITEGELESLRVNIPEWKG